MAEKTITGDSMELENGLWTFKNQEKFCDVTVTIKGEKIAVHAAVLASKSKFFENAFEKNHKNVTLENVDKNHVQSIIDYCYKGVIRINERNVQEIFKLASKVLIPNIAEGCSKIMIKTLNVNNCLTMWITAKSGISESFKQAILKFIYENLDKVFDSSDFLAMKSSDVIDILSSRQMIYDTSEMAVYEAVMKWINHHKSRSANLMDLLDHIKLECLPREFLLSESQSICKSNESCRLKFVNAMERQKDSLSLKCSNFDTLIAIGNDKIDATKIIEIFDKNKQEWIEIRNNDCKNHGFSTVLVNNKLMIIGGELNGHRSNTVEYYDIKTGHTETLPKKKYKRSHPAAINFGEIVYVFGGFNEGKATANVEKWDPSTRTWADVESMTNARYAFGVANLGSEIFAVGGINGKDYYSEVEVYNPETNIWRNCAPMIEKRCYHGVATVGNYIYAVGGASDRLLRSVERYDPIIDKWTMVKSMENLRSGGAAVSLHDQLITAGGTPENDPVNTVEAYDEKTDQWKPKPSMKNPRSGLNLISVPWSLAKFALARKTSV